MILIYFYGIVEIKMKERIRVYSKSKIREIGEDRRTQIELRDARGCLGGSYGRRNGFRNLDLTEFMFNSVEKPVTSGSNGQRDHAVSISRIEEVFSGRTETVRAVVFEASERDIKDRIEFEKKRVLEYIRTGKKITMTMRIFATKKGIPPPKAVMHHIR